MSLTYVVEYKYIDGINEKAHAVRDEHMAYRESINDLLVMAGPLIGSEDLPVGSMMIVRAADQAEAEKVASGEPFVGAGVTEVVSVRLIRVSKVNPI